MQVIASDAFGSNSDNVITVHSYIFILFYTLRKVQNFHLLTLLYVT